jgi:hypothetical protein
MKRVSSILVASVFAFGAAVPAFAWTNSAANLNHGTKLIAGAGVHKTAVVSDEDSSDGSQQPEQPQQPPSSDDGE